MGGMGTFTPILRHYRLYGDGTESGSSALAAEDTLYDYDLAGSNQPLHVRVLIEETGAAADTGTKSWQLQYSKNGGTWTNVTGSSSNVQSDSSSGLTDGAATTNRGTEGLTDPGGGTFNTGIQEEADGTFNYTMSASVFTEHVWACTIVEADLANADQLTFRVSYNGGTPGFTHDVTPTVDITKATVTKMTATKGSTAGVSGAALDMQMDLAATVGSTSGVSGAKLDGVKTMTAAYGSTAGVSTSNLIIKLGLSATAAASSGVSGAALDSQMDLSATVGATSGVTGAKLDGLVKISRTTLEDAYRPDSTPNSGTTDWNSSSGGWHLDVDEPVDLADDISSYVNRPDPAGGGDTYIEFGFTMPDGNRDRPWRFRIWMRRGIGGTVQANGGIYQNGVLKTSITGLYATSLWAAYEFEFTPDDDGFTDMSDSVTVRIDPTGTKNLDVSAVELLPERYISQAKLDGQVPISATAGASAGVSSADAWAATTLDATAAASSGVSSAGLDLTADISATAGSTAGKSKASLTIVGVDDGNDAALMVVGVG